MTDDRMHEIQTELNRKIAAEWPDSDKETHDAFVIELASKRIAELERRAKKAERDGAAFQRNLNHALGVIEQIDTLLYGAGFLPESEGTIECVERLCESKEDGDGA